MKLKFTYAIIRVFRSTIAILLCLKLNQDGMNDEKILIERKDLVVNEIPLA
jgi:hypothetical protein